MNCKNCGAEIAANSKFCTKCGVMINDNYEQINYNENIKKKETLGTISLVLGIISLLLAFLLNIFILPLAIIGLVLGIINKVKKGKNITGIILNSISIFIAIIMAIIVIFVFKSKTFSEFFSSLYNELDYKNSSNYVAGRYDCTGVDDNVDEYLISLHLNEDNTFIYGPYGELTSNYITGTYTYEDEKKTNKSGQYKYFKVYLKGDKTSIDGEISDEKHNAEMEFGITSQNAKKQGVVLFVSSNYMYYCYEN